MSQYFHIRQATELQVLLQFCGLPDMEVLRHLEYLLFVDDRVEVKSNESLPLRAVAEDILFDNGNKLEGAEEDHNHGENGFIGWLAELLVLL